MNRQFPVSPLAYLATGLALHGGTVKAAAFLAPQTKLVHQRHCTHQSLTPHLSAALYISLPASIWCMD